MPAPYSLLPTPYCRSLRRHVLRLVLQHRRGPRVATAAVHRRLVEEGEQAVIVALRQGVELVVVAAAAVEGEAQPDGAGRLGHVHYVIDAVLLGDATALAVDRMIAAERRRQLLLRRCPGQEVAGQLPDGELVERQVAIERVNGPVAPRPHGAF